MNSLKTTVCQEHTPHIPAISNVRDEQYTFCESCENNIDRFWLEFDGDRLDMWSKWRVTQ